jgi:Ca2+-binding EF-hand superfamily protein
VFPKISQEELSAFFISSDKNEDGLIDYDEYLHASLENEDGNLNLEEYQIY